MTLLIFTYQVLWATMQLFKGRRKSKITATRNTSPGVFILVCNSSQSNCAAGHSVYVIWKFESYTRDYFGIIFTDIYITYMIDLFACFEVLCFTELVPKFWLLQAFKNHIQSKARETSLPNFHFLNVKTKSKFKHWHLYDQNTSSSISFHRPRDQICIYSSETWRSSQPNI